MALQTASSTEEEESRHHARSEAADEFDNGWTDSARSALSIQGESPSGGKSISHTFFGQEETGLNMLVSEQKQLEKMQAYSFQQFKQIQKMMIQMQKSQQWSFNNIQAEIGSVQKEIDKNHQEEETDAHNLSHSLAMTNYYTKLRNDMIKNINTTNVDLNCTNVFYCENGVNCTEVSVCRKNDTCSQIEKCD